MSARIDLGRGRIWALGALLLVTLASVAPLVSLVLALSIAGLLGCRLDEGSVHPCLAMGTDIGGLLSGAAILGWLNLLTLPVLAICLVIWLVLAVLRYRRRSL